MTEKYVAPTNGHEIRVNELGGMSITYPGMSHVKGHDTTHLKTGRVQSLREFFRDERDKELRRWRWPENSSVVVYPSGSGSHLHVFDEYTQVGVRYRFGEANHVSQWVQDAGEAYFDAHPVKKPWHDAKPGDTWVIATTLHPGEFAVIATTEGELQSANGFCYDPTDTTILSGRRIWERI